MRRKWILRETGETRMLLPGEWFLGADGEILHWTLKYNSSAEYPVLTYTEICPEHDIQVPCPSCELIAKEYQETSGTGKN